MTDPYMDLNPESEEKFLVSLLLSATARDLREEALRQVAPEDFASGKYGGLWEAARNLLASGKRIDRRGLVAAAASPGAEHAVRSLDGIVPRPAEFPGALAEVKRCSAARRIVETASRMQQRALAAEDPSEALSAAHEELKALEPDGQSSKHVHQFGDLLDQFAHIMKTQDNYEIIPTPWAEVNERIAGGLHAGRMYVVAARPGEGKSIAGHQLAEHAASLGFPSAVFSVEMGGVEVVGRIVANAASIEMDEISRRALSSYSWQQFEEYRGRANSFPITINDRPDLTIGYIASECRSYGRRRGLNVVVIDYLQLLKGERGMTREQEISQVSRSLKQLSRELEMAVVVPAQLNRKSIERGKPLLSDIRESGSIEQDADVVMLLARQQDEFGNSTGRISINIAKNRHGRVGDFDLAWRPHYSRIG